MNLGPATLDFLAAEWFLLQNVPEPFAPAFPDPEYLYNLILEPPLNTQPTQGTTPDSPLHRVPDPLSLAPQIPAPADDTTSLRIIYSASVSLPPPIPQPQAITLPPPDWHRIPQKTYNYGRKQWDFTPSECISFGVNGRPGMNVGDALRKRFTDLDGRDELVLQDANRAISCRFSVRFHDSLCLKRELTSPRSSPDIPPTTYPRY